jgi:hypothetical protein
MLKMKRHKPKSREKSKRVQDRNRHSRPVPLAKLPKRSAQARTNALHVLSEMRRNPNVKLSAAARSFGVKPSVVKKYFGSSLEKVNGHWRVHKSDHFREVMYVPDAHGNPVPVHTGSSNERKQVSAYLRDIGRFLRGNKHAMAKWHGKRTAGVELVTASRTLIAIESQLSDFSIYNAFNGGAE